MRSEEFWAYFETLRTRLDVRAENFEHIFKHLDGFDRPVRIIETGCVCNVDDWYADGGSTLLFDTYAKFHPGSILYSVDRDENATILGRHLTSDRVRFHTGDSITFLKALADTPPDDLEAIDLLYLDSYPVNYDNEFPGAFHHLQEYLAISPLVRPETLVVVDDAPLIFAGSLDANKQFRMVSSSHVGGNGKLIADYALHIRAENCFVGHQSGWRQLKANTRRPPGESKYLRGIITKSPHGTFAVGIEDEHVGRSLREHGQNGAHEVANASQYVTSKDKVLVVGAHVGTIAVPLAKHCDHLIAVEANPWTYRLLKANIALNDVTNITTLNLAASDKEETIKFVMNTANSGGSKRLPRVHENMYFYDSPQIIDIEAHSLDEIIGSQEFALVFMDIEGSEYFALKGMKRILQSTPVLILEFIPHLLRNVAGVEPEEFAELLMPYFNELHVLSLNERVKKAEFSTTLRRMYDCDHSDMGLIFKK